MFNFKFNNVKIERNKGTSQLAVKGEITNCNEKSYNTIAIRIVLFNKNITIYNMVFVINSLAGGATKNFERIIDELNYNEIGKNITHHEIYAESCF